MLIQKRAAANKIYSIHVLPDGSRFAGEIKAGGSGYQFAFAPKAASVSNGNLVLTGAVSVKSPGGRQASSDVTATLLATQGSTTSPPRMPGRFSESLKA